jgi:hypothetical protein
MDGVHAADLKSLKRGDFFKLSATPNAPVYVKGDYDRGAKKFSCHRWDDMCDSRLMAGTRTVFVGFSF